MCLFFVCSVKQLYEHWKLGYIDESDFNSTISDLVECKELGDITIWYDSCATMNFVSPERFNQLKHYQEHTNTIVKVRTGSKEEFLVDTYLKLNLVNLSGDLVELHFYPAPGLAKQNKIEFLLSYGATHAMGYKMQKQKDIIIVNKLNEFEAIDEEEFNKLDIWSNMSEAKHLFQGKNREEINYNYINNIISHVKDIKAKNILLKKLYKYPLVISTRHKFNISYIPGIKFDVDFKKDSKWKRQPPIKLSSYHQQKLDQEIEKYLKAGFLEIATDTSVYAAPMFFIEKKRPQNAKKDWIPELRMCCDFTQFNQNCKQIIEQIPSCFEIVSQAAQKKKFILLDFRQAYHHFKTSQKVRKYLRCIDYRGRIYI